MSRLLESLRSLIARQVTDHGIVVWYDPERAYSEVVDQLALPGVEVAKYEDGFFRLREQIEPLLEWIGDNGQPIRDGDIPPNLLVYIPKARGDSGFALVEIETAGVVIEPGAPSVECNTRLEALASRVFSKVAPEKAEHLTRQVEEGLLRFADLELIVEEAGAASTGALKLIYGTVSPVEALLLFAASTDRDQALVERKALGELAELASEELGFHGKTTEEPEKLRQSLHRHLLSGELLLGIPESAHDALSNPAELPDRQVQREAIRHLCQTWRNRLDLADSYAKAAQAIGSSLGLEPENFPAEVAVALETFGVIDRALIIRATELLLDGRTDKPVEWARDRKGRFWPRRDAELLLEWSLIEFAGDLIRLALRVTANLKDPGWTLDSLVAAYTRHAEPWMLLDSCARHLESRYARLYLEGPTSTAQSTGWEKLMAKCRTTYASAIERMAVVYSGALEVAGFTSERVPPQRDMFVRSVRPALQEGRQTACLLVDALRYEMAAELVEGLREEFEVELEPALGQLPGITLVGMAALMPGTENGLSIERHAGRLHALIDGVRITDRAPRMAWLQERTPPGTLILKLADVQRLTPKRRKDLSSAPLVVVTSQEIDRLGEESGDQEEARVYMEDVLEKLRRGIRTLAAGGATRIVIAADHGFLYAEGPEVGHPMDTPGGDTVELHPRCWIGLGGSAAPGFFRVTAAKLGLGGELECAFPRGLSTFKVKGGTGTFFHGGATLQEQIIPIAVLARRAPPARRNATSVRISLGKPTITNRLFSVGIELESDDMFDPEPTRVRFEVMEGKRIVGEAAVATYGFDASTREVSVEPGKLNSVTLMLTVSSPPAKLTINVVDCKSDAIAASLAEVPINLAI